MKILLWACEKVVTYVLMHPLLMRVLGSQVVTVNC